MSMAVKERSRIKPVYTITGTVVHGRGIGKHVGTPTANIEADKAAPLPETGVYASKILLDGQTYYGVTHVGARPTLDNDKTVAIETHLFDFDGDLYGRTITICLYKKLREVRKFNELSGLIEQVEKDRLLARTFWGWKQTDCTLSMDAKKRCVMIDGREVYLSVHEFDVLYLLYAFPQTTFTKEQIYEKVWHEPANHHVHAVENTVFQIRKRLKPYCKGREYIKTVIGYGYKFHSD